VAQAKKLAPTKRPRTPRRQQFVDVAARLFSARGYHAVGINDISAELGLSGPAIYRHYPSKEALLVAVFDNVITDHLEKIRDIVSSMTEVQETLRAIVDHHIAFVFDQTENLVTWRTEFQHLPEADRHRLRYLQRLYTEEWVRTVRRLRPELSDDQVRAMCHGVIALLQSPTEFHSSLKREELAPLLRQMALQAFLADPAGGEGWSEDQPTPAAKKRGRPRKTKSE
jgi:AcrR family transcriptional regulator